jgi:putative membrane protein
VSAAWHSVIIGLPVLLVHLALTTGLLLAGLAVYLRFAHCRELELLRNGNIAAAVVFSGQMLSLAIPLSAMLASSVNVPDILLWGFITVVLQFIAIFCLRRLLPGLPDSVLQGKVAPAIVYASGQLVTGLITAAALAG